MDVDEVPHEDRAGATLRVFGVPLSATLAPAHMSIKRENEAMRMGAFNLLECEFFRPLRAEPDPSVADPFERTMQETMESMEALDTMQRRQQIAPKSVLWMSLKRLLQVCISFSALPFVSFRGVSHTYCV